ncbi:MAG: hypothetical protein AB8B72_13625 [Crocinitomicaceae bacterium]
MSSAEIDFYFNNEDIGGIDEGWERFNNDFGNSSGLLSFSRIAFNDGDTQAVFEISQSCGSLCGQGLIVFLEKEDGNWVYKGVVPTWIA